MGVQIQVCHLGIADFDSFFKVLFHQVCGHGESCACGGGLQIMENNAQGFKWYPCPVFGDLTEEAMFNGIPF